MGKQTMSKYDVNDKLTCKYGFTVYVTDSDETHEILPNMKFIILHKEESGDNAIEYLLLHLNHDDVPMLSLWEEFIDKYFTIIKEDNESK